MDLRVTRSPVITSYYSYFGNYFIEQGWCSENPLKFIRDLEVTERPFLWLQSAGEVQKLLSAVRLRVQSRRDLKVLTREAQEIFKQLPGHGIHPQAIGI